MAQTRQACYSIGMQRARNLHEQREELRQSFQPPKVRLLFVGEAPPASGRFFYNRDSGLYRAMRDAFQAADPAITDDDFLSVFQASGCYLIDACAEAVDHLGERERRRERIVSEASLARRIQELQPPVIVVLLKSLRQNVERAARCAGWQGRLIDVPYPGRWIRFRAEFVESMIPELRSVLGGRFDDGIDDQKFNGHPSRLE
jgi:hypothetical protein